VETEKTLWGKDLAQKGTTYFILQLVFPHKKSSYKEIRNSEAKTADLREKRPALMTFAGNSGRNAASENELIS